MTETQNIQQNKIDIKSLNYEELEQCVLKMGQKPFRAKQLYQWMHQNLVTSLMR